MASNRIQGRWTVFLQGLGLAVAWVISLALYAGTISIVAYAITEGSHIGG